MYVKWNVRFSRVIQWWDVMFYFFICYCKYINGPGNRLVNHSKSKPKTSMEALSEGSVLLTSPMKLSYLAWFKNKNRQHVSINSREIGRLYVETSHQWADCFRGKASPACSGMLALWGWSLQQQYHSDGRREFALVDIIHMSVPSTVR